MTILICTNLTLSPCVLTATTYSDCYVFLFHPTHAFGFCDHYHFLSFSLLFHSHSLYRSRIAIASKPKMCLHRINDLKDNLGNRLETIPFLDEEHDRCDYFDVDTGNSWITHSDDLICI